MKVYKNKLDNYSPEKPCLKQSVKALIITKDGKEVYGANDIRNEVTVCPRVEKGCKTGEGYDLCKSVCNQNFHAEVSAIQNAKEKGIDIKGSTLYLVNHTYCCDNCIAKMKIAGIKEAHILLEDGKTHSYEFLD